MKIAYIAHPISGNEEENIKKVISIVREINLSQKGILPFAPYIVDLKALDDSSPTERMIGITNNQEYFMRGIIDELWVYGISPGVKQEIELAKRFNIKIVYKNSL